jgi:hypothetical protein
MKTFLKKFLRSSSSSYYIPSYTSVLCSSTVVVTLQFNLMS